jgi:hypothetical protein
MAEFSGERRTLQELTNRGDEDRLGSHLPKDTKEKKKKLEVAEMRARWEAERQEKLQAAKAKKAADLTLLEAKVLQSNLERKADIDEKNKRENDSKEVNRQYLISKRNAELTAKASQQAAVKLKRDEETALKAVVKKLAEDASDRTRSVSTSKVAEAQAAALTDNVALATQGLLKKELRRRSLAFRVGEAARRADFDARQRAEALATAHEASEKARQDAEDVRALAESGRRRKRESLAGRRQHALHGDKVTAESDARELEAGHELSLTARADAADAADLDRFERARARLSLAGRHALALAHASLDHHHHQAELAAAKEGAERARAEAADAQTVADALRDGGLQERRRASRAGRNARWPCSGRWATGAQAACGRAQAAEAAVALRDDRQAAAEAARGRRQAEKEQFAAELAWALGQAGRKRPDQALDKAEQGAASIVALKAERAEQED